MNKEQLLAWAVKNVTAWGRLSIGATNWKTEIRQRFDEDNDVSVLVCGDNVLTRREWEAAKLAEHEVSFEPFVSVEDAPVTAHSILEAAGGHMRDRAATYDKPEGERSMGATVDAFRAITGHKLTEEQGWLFMQLLKAVRSQQGAYRADSYEDGCAYVSLAGEAAARERGSNEAEG